jgi:hypothetical protein
MSSSLIATEAPNIKIAAFDPLATHASVKSLHGHFLPWIGFSIVDKQDEILFRLALTKLCGPKSNPWWDVPTPESNVYHKALIAFLHRQEDSDISCMLKGDLLLISTFRRKMLFKMTNSATNILHECYTTPKSNLITFIPSAFELIDKSEGI